MEGRRVQVIKQEPYTATRSRGRRRLHSPVVFDDRRNIKSKRSRISSPVLLDESFDHGSESRLIKPDPFSKNRAYIKESFKREPGTDSHENLTLTRDHNGGVRVHGSGSKDLEFDQHHVRIPNKPVSKTAKEHCNFGLSGKLTADTNSYKGVVIKYNEPEDARKPTRFWRLYPFKGSQALKVLHIHRQSGYLIGSDARVVEIPMLHPSISKQHAVLQFRFTKGKERLYVIDLDSTNGTYLNGSKIETRRYYELHEKDILKFGYSTREYVVMTDKVDSDEDND